eukprot:1108865-Pyramimonas_sp.AAC.1
MTATAAPAVEATLRAPWRHPRAPPPTHTSGNGGSSGAREGRWRSQERRRRARATGSQLEGDMSEEKLDPRKAPIARVRRRR